jgi:hypothetical protein
VLNVRDEGRLRYVKSSGEQIIDEGHASGSFPGWVKVRFLYDGEPTVSARFTIYGNGGSVSAQATARLSSPTSPSPSFKGSMRITGGTVRRLQPPQLRADRAGDRQAPVLTVDEAGGA